MILLVCLIIGPLLAQGCSSRKDVEGCDKVRHVGVLIVCPQSNFIIAIQIYIHIMNCYDFPPTHKPTRKSENLYILVDKAGL